MVARTSIVIYHDEIKGNKELTQAEQAYKAVKKCAPCTMRQVQKVTGLEINVVSRALNTCKNLQWIEVLFAGKSGKRVVSHFVDIR
jgi:predicted transcriptional regulator